MSRLAPRSALVRIAGNAASLLTTDVLNKATTFVIYALVARYHGPQAFGQLSLGLLLVYVFQVFATVGLPNLLTRQIAKRASSAPLLLSSGLAAAGLMSAFSMLFMSVTAWVMRYDTATTLVIVILSGGLLPYAAAQVFEASFRGRQRMHLIAISNLVANSAKIVGAVWMLSYGFGTLWLAGLLVLVRVLHLLMDVLLYFFVDKESLIVFDRRFVRALVKRSSTFLGIDAAIAGWSAVDALILSKLMTEVEVGLYCSAIQLLQPASLVYLSIVGSIFPAMCSRTRTDPRHLCELTRWMVAFLLMLGMPLVMLIPAFADVILQLAYADSNFQRAVPVMQIAAFALIAQCFTTILGHALWAANRERESLNIVLVNLSANLLISCFTISYWGLVGAAVGTLLVSCLNVVQHYVAYWRVLHVHPVDRQILNPVFAGVVMCVVLWCVPASNRYAIAAWGAAAYGGVVLGLLSLAHGGPKKLREGFFAPLVS